MKLSQIYYFSLQKRDFELLDEKILISFYSPTNSWQDSYMYQDLEALQVHVRSCNSTIKALAFYVFMAAGISSILKLSFYFSLSLLIFSFLLLTFYFFYKENFVVFKKKNNDNAGFAIRITKNNTEAEFLKKLTSILNDKKKS
ncbi:MAG: hypothetical protein RI911_73 [Candidatus Parcubacteria bacterium]|jgi:hypothetical protein